MRAKIALLVRQERERERDLAGLGTIKVLLGGTVLVHDPVGALALGSTASIENQGLLHPNQGAIGARLAGLDGSVLARGFPVASVGGPVRTMPIRVLPITRKEEEPLRIVRLYHRQPFFIFIINNTK